MYICQYKNNKIKRKEENSATFDKYGSPGRARTADPMINSHLLYRLSYRGKTYLKAIVKNACLHGS